MPGGTPGQTGQMGQEDQASPGAQVPVEMPTVQLSELAEIKSLVKLNLFRDEWRRLHWCSNY